MFHNEHYAFQGKFNINFNFADSIFMLARIVIFHPRRGTLSSFRSAIVKNVETRKITWDSSQIVQNPLPTHKISSLESTVFQTGI